jgi:hypothetical protein
MTRIEKLEMLIQIEEGIKSFEDRIELKQDSIESTTYMMCIKRLNERFNKILVTI